MSLLMLGHMSHKAMLYGAMYALLSSIHKPLIKVTRKSLGHPATRSDPRNFVLINAMYATVLLAVITGILLLVFPVPHVDPMLFLLPALLAGCLQFIGGTQGTAAFEEGNLGLIVPFNGLVPLVQLFIVWGVKGREPKIVGLIGVALVAFGVFVAYQKKAAAASPAPVAVAGAPRTWLGRSLYGHPGRRYGIALTAWTIYAFPLTSATGAITSKFYPAAQHKLPPVAPYLTSGVVLLVMTVLGTIHCYYNRVVELQDLAVATGSGSTGLLKEAFIEMRRSVRSGAVELRRLFVISASLVAIEQYFELTGLWIGPIPAVSALFKLSIFFNVPMSWLVFWCFSKFGRRRWGVEPGERLTLRIIVTAILVTFGAILIG